MSSTVFALLDDASLSPSSERRSRCYTDYTGSLQLHNGDDDSRFFEDLQRALDQGFYAVTLFTYEFGHRAHRIDDDRTHADEVRDVKVDGHDDDQSIRQRIQQRRIDHQALATVLLFRSYQRLSTEEVNAWLVQQTSARSYAVTQIQPSLPEAEFVQAVDRIKRYIEAGDIYQANFTFPLRFAMHGDPVALYAALRERQPVPYGALIALPDGSSVLSLSPELFVRHAQGQLTCRPMKGTAAASDDDVLNTQRIQGLQESTKERAENLMIVDLLRNDLGRIAVTGSVKVPDLFSVERFGAVLQMTSTIVADRRAGTRLSEVFEALYPCGSITGAPKRRAMQILHALEPWPRRLYTGAIGWFDPPTAEQELGDFALSVPIRTLLLDAPNENDYRQAEMGIGAGIVYDSDALAEYQECLLKARFLTGMPSAFNLFETMRANRHGCDLLDRHLIRLASSARAFGFPFDLAAARQRVIAECAVIADEHDYRLRLVLTPSGEIQLHSAPLQLVQQPVRLLLSPIVMSSEDVLLAHKTSLRHVYDEGWQQAERVGAFDTLFFNEHGKLTEGGRSNVLIKLDDQWVTPPLSAGVLPGVMRSLLLEDTDWNVIERSITLMDLRRAQAVCVCNALRGVLQAEIIWDA
jgi:para-aminobenzoate synthetase/4-amino-4-deoxychorismate lyase